MNGLINLSAIENFLTEVCKQYSKTSPVVCNWAEGLYERVIEQTEAVTLLEIVQLDRLREDGLWLRGDYAQNLIYKLMERIGQDTTGLASF